MYSKHICIGKMNTPHFPFIVFDSPFFSFNYTSNTLIICQKQKNGKIVVYSIFPHIAPITILCCAYKFAVTKLWWNLIIQLELLSLLSLFTLSLWSASPGFQVTDFFFPEREREYWFIFTKLKTYVKNVWKSKVQGQN